MNCEGNSLVNGKKVSSLLPLLGNNSARLSIACVGMMSRTLKIVMPPQKLVMTSHCQSQVSSLRFSNNGVDIPAGHLYVIRNTKPFHNLC